jgi:hypothetical protein
MFGMSDHQAGQAFNIVLDNIYTNHDLLVLGRTLALPGSLAEIFDFLIQATNRNEKLRTFWQPTLDQYCQNHGLPLGSMLLCLMAWDSRHVRQQKSLNDFHDLQNLFSTKVHGQAIVVTVATGLDGKGVWMAPVGASSSHRNTDESLNRLVGVATFY